jgi:hypothetical protein
VAGVSLAATWDPFSSLAPLPFNRSFILLLTAATCFVLAGCEADVSTPASTERSALLSPDFVARAAASATSDPQAKWLLNQPKQVRESYVNDVLDKPGDRTLLSTAWLLGQSAPVRESYVQDVVQPQLAQKAKAKAP